MDHLELPKDRNPLAVVVPYSMTLAIQYETLKIPRGKLVMSALEDRSAEDRVGLLQALFYFRLLRDVLGCPPSELISGQRISTRKLPEMIAAKERDIQAMVIVTVEVTGGGPTMSTETKIDDSNVRIERARIAGVIEEIMEACDRLDVLWDIPGWSETHLAIKLLAERLSSLAGIEFRRTEKSPDQASIRLIWQHMVIKGKWCTHQARYLLSENSYETLFYLANLQRRERPSTDHSACLHHERCIANNVDNDHYVSSHVEPGCRCEHVAAPTHQMHEILQSGRVPVVKCEQKKNSDPILSYVEAVPGAKYAAISHLWADGLGNPGGQSMPRCQLMRLACRVKECDNRVNRGTTNPSAGPDDDQRLLVYFWLDVYCVPVTRDTISDLDRTELAQELHLRELKSTALARMTASYSWAMYVLVLDFEISQFSGKRSLTEVTARTAVCNWNTRCWTYQEFVLGREIVVYFSDGPRVLFDIGSGRTENQQGTFPGPGTSSSPQDKEQSLLQSDLARLTHQELQKIGTSSGRSLRYVRRKTGNMNRGVALISLCNTLHHKTTTKPEDALHILSNLLGLSGAELSTMDPKSQLKAVFKTISDRGEGNLWPFDWLLADLPRYYKVRDPSGLPCSFEDRWIPTDIYKCPIDAKVGGMKPEDGGLRIYRSRWADPNDRAAMFTVSWSSERRWLVKLSHGVTGISSAHERILIELGLEDIDPLDGYTKRDVFLILRKSSKKRGSGACFVPTLAKRPQRRLGTVRVLFLCNVKWQIVGTATTIEYDVPEVLGRVRTEWHTQFDIKVVCSKWCKVIRIRVQS